ncbi:DUF1960-domain-containing protein [Rhizopus microsporus var. microsporus]|uniref:DUF1960-domain-containing protein n=2 Tax=Rhizopus microsporus TaxID=58291 RepID=A0A2G4T7J6_RHIZD|nr:DUF1960-domain-containing protein [Rhizopus microsporus ATCC 52813]ORE08525.1 DUF1960-domain-containing protein [Rhizopus microsporus var. microsporus]PHZ16977.1 DUF1960-domain-containing protein [Rhizopus microsporus ATCC 52813]
MPNKNATKVVYKSPDDVEYFVIANTDMIDKYRKDKSIPLIDVVQTFDIHTTVAGGNTGEYIRPSKGALESAFGTHKPEEIAKYIVEHGEEKGMH